MAFLAPYIFENYYGTQWTIAVNFSGAEFNWDQHEHLTRAQFVGGPDYESAIQWAARANRPARLHALTLTSLKEC